MNRTVNTGGRHGGALRYSCRSRPMSFYGYRYLSTTSGRWDSRDRAGERGGAHLYVGINNDALTRTDPLGLFSMSQAACVRGIAVFWTTHVALRGRIEDLTNSCPLTVTCACCNEANIGARIRPDPTNVQIFYCRDNSFSFHDSYLVHELRHYMDICAQRNDRSSDPNERCRRVLCNEMRAHYTDQSCRDLRSCLYAITIRGYFGRYRETDCAGASWPIVRSQLDTCDLTLMRY